MKIAVTGATGFIGRYIVHHLVNLGHTCRCWYRPQSDRGGFDGIENHIDWVPGDLDGGDEASLLDGCEAVVHAALYHPGGGFRGGEGDLVSFVQRNIVGTIRLIEAARAEEVGRFVFISTCAVHERILDDRPLDEKHPSWPSSHYGAHKAALEAFVHSYGRGHEFPICALRPTGVYGLARPAEDSKWYRLVRSVVHGASVSTARGGKEVHASDVARAAGILLTADHIHGEVFNCYDRYISEWEVAHLAKNFANSQSEIQGQPIQPKHQIETGKLRALGMNFGGERLLRDTIEKLIWHLG